MSTEAERLVLGRLGALLLDAGLSVTEVTSRVGSVAESVGVDDVTVSVLPRDVFVADRGTGRMSAVKSTGEDLSMRQTALSVRLVGRIVSGVVSYADVPTWIDAVRERRRRHPAAAGTAGACLISAGMAIVFRCPWWAILSSLVIGALVGLGIAAIRRAPASVAVLPFVMAFGTTVLVGVADRAFDLGPVPLFAVCAPVAILVPGALITNALLELTAADVVTGASRLMYGVAMLGFMTAGIRVGADVSGVELDTASAAKLAQAPRLENAADAWQALPPVWMSWLGVVVLAVGLGLAFGAGYRLSAVALTVMLGVYGVLTALEPIIGDVAAFGVIAGVTYLASQIVERFWADIPSVVFFYPAFLLLVPGTVGLVSLTSSDPGAIATALGTFISLCVGIKVGELLAGLRLRG